MIPVIDLFAGPGGLSEGFSSLKNEQKSVFKVVLSIEKEELAHKTLRLRAFFRQFRRSDLPGDYYDTLRGKLSIEQLYARHKTAAEESAEEAWQASLGGTPHDHVNRRIEKRLPNSQKPWILIGGPPCQAYSLVGRSRRRSDPAFENDEKHGLYKQYLRILVDHRPHVFVMENVKGILSSTHKGKRIVDRIIDDLKNPAVALDSSAKSRLSYRLYPLAEYQEDLFESRAHKPSDFIIRAEEHGIPQMRHRFILLGVRDDISASPERLRNSPDRVSMWQVIKDLAPLRSQLSKEEDSPQAWRQAIRALMSRVGQNGRIDEKLRTQLKIAAESLSVNDSGAPFIEWSKKPLWQQEWFYDEELKGICNHQSRGHIRNDLWRYLYAACFATVEKRSPVLSEFPEFLLPNHDNIFPEDSGEEIPFADRFRVQVKDRPSTTITSHISKDGHYFIHPDPKQCRSLTVREAARLQTFPDNYFFVGGRTAQYQQVGNAVPPLLAFKIAEKVAGLLERSSLG
ncbi:MAG: DNA cytosine methyltransferase [Terriglobales bacterium]